MQNSFSANFAQPLKLYTFFKIRQIIQEYNNIQDVSSKISEYGELKYRLAYILVGLASTLLFYNQISTLVFF